MDLKKVYFCFCNLLAVLQHWVRGHFTRGLHCLVGEALCHGGQITHTGPPNVVVDGQAIT